jgi:pyruvate formate lyase activating enzyme
MKKVREHYIDIGYDTVQCTLCPLNCNIGPSRPGMCGVRFNRHAELISENYGRVSVLAACPIEQLPLYHFHPGAPFLFVGSIGCNMKCPFCNTWHVAQSATATRYVKPEELVVRAQELELAGIAYTFNEPTVWYEYMMDVARLAREANLLNVVATNGLISSAALRELLPLIDAVVVGIKRWNREYYQVVCGGRMTEILNNLVTIIEHCHLELSYLVFPDDESQRAELREMVRWILELSPEIPVHLLQYRPYFHMNDKETSVADLYSARAVVKARLPFVYLSSTTDKDANATHCPSCGLALIKREKGGVDTSGLSEGTCKRCKAKVTVVGV